jgi:enoyl-[acyl-carrier protein] reductase I
VLDGALHAVAFAPPDALGGHFLSTPSASAIESFHVSAFSFKELGAALAPLLALSDPGGSLVGLDFDASVAWPSYDWMGVAKGALEAVARYLARDLGESGIRVNLVSAGPLSTPAASGVPGFERLAEIWALQAPLGWCTNSPAIVADAICFLFSDLARGVSAEIVHVDGGAHAMGTGK